MAKASSFFGGQYLSVTDLDGKPITGKIDSITFEVLENKDGQSRERIILHLDRVDKPIVVNATNGDRLIEAFGDETDSWIGKTVSAKKGTVPFMGKRVDSIVLTPEVNLKK